MNLSSNLYENVSKLRQGLNLGKTFDVIERIIDVHNTKFYLYYLDGFVKDTNMEYVRRDMYNLKKEDFEGIKTATDLIEKALSSIETSTEKDIEKIISAVLSGQTALLGPNYTEAVLLDFRTYPSRGVEEPEKEKVLRGSHDGFVETIVFNTALIRRRIRSSELTFEMHSIGSVSKTDVVVGYLGNKVDNKKLEKIKELIDELNIKSLTLGDQSFVEVVNSKSWLNPFPKVRYTERPDVAAAQIMEGSIVILIDNTPSALILPSNIFDFLQSIDDYYMPVLTGNYLKFVRFIVLFANLFLTPLYVLLTDNPSWISGNFQFLLPKDPYILPIFIQFLIAEIAIDGIKLASLDTPSTLGTSLSIIGGLILGDYTVQTGWFTPQTILYMAIVALSSFTQPSIELGFAFKFIRIILLLLTGIFGTWGFILGIIINFIIIASTKTVLGDPYLYPLIPFKWRELKKLLFRWKKQIAHK
ncbi:spore germination protein [Clostridium septicum]|uniref:Spore germination protein n=1 Tax=Clostridium septicum TaxID=1504 RepID=A0A9N7JN36_CLOSE|nr:spore germination protein [Clostridium septicum]AYE34974.1 spore germination protein [Clostridium septicum]MDU1314636.1 spore germination protein [Clostridium septicum]QAS60367.1 spore germination protein [Clostridium septicum]UEC20377.1 spore germination protein [Clostridium septicum]USS01568.1 spore germination protein [Clostridium septicum]